MSGFLDSLARALTLGGMSFRVLWLDKELLLFPLMSLIALAAVYGGIFGPVIAVLVAGGPMPGLFGEAETPEALMEDPRYWAVLLILYFLSCFVVIFFNAGLVYCAMIRLFGGDPAVMDGLRASWKVLPQIFAWALFASTVKLLIDMLASRSALLTRLIVGAVSIAWGVATYFAVPVLVVEEVGPLSALRQSAATIRKTWGEALVNHAGLGALHALVVLVAALLMFAGVRMQADQAELAITLYVLAAVVFLSSTLVVVTLGSIVKAALYVYAVKGSMPAALFDETTLKQAFSNRE